jgi:hypothetical protein
VSDAPHRFSRLAGGWHIGAAFFVREGLATQAPAPRGLVDRLEDLAGDGVDCARVAPSVRAFFEDPASLDLRVRSRWRVGFGLAWRLARGVMGAIGQLHLPLDTAQVRTRMVAIDGAREGRTDARGVVRAYADTNEVFQVFAYGVARTPAGPRMSVAIPLPGGHLAGLLRLDVSNDGAEVVLTSRPASRDDHVGVWFVTRFGSLPLPLEETLRFWSADAPAAPAFAQAGATLVALHAQRLFGSLVVEHEYSFRPLAE